jgi:hypothetical protein
MNTTKLLTAAAVVAAIASPAFAQSFATAPARSGASISCSIPNNVVCTITSQKGLKKVVIKSNTPQGTVNLVNKTYYSCPKSVTVSWDSAYHSSSNQFTECSGAKLKLN